jgi:hypothetical protein
MKVSVLYSMYKHHYFNYFLLLWHLTKKKSLLGNQCKSETREKLNMTSKCSKQSRSYIFYTCRDMSLTFWLQTTCIHASIYIYIYTYLQCSFISVTVIIYRSITKSDIFLIDDWLKPVCLISKWVILILTYLPIRSW